MSTLAKRLRKQIGHWFASSWKRNMNWTKVMLGISILMALKLKNCWKLKRLLSLNCNQILTHWSKLQESCLGLKDHQQKTKNSLKIPFQNVWFLRLPPQNRLRIRLKSNSSLLDLALRHFSSLPQPNLRKSCPLRPQKLTTFHSLPSNKNKTWAELNALKTL